MQNQDLVAAFAERLADIVPVVETAEIRFAAPARGTITAHARVMTALWNVKRRKP